MDSMIGQTLGQYQLVQQIGKGGMATVYKAYQPALDRYVAVKILPAYFAHEPGFAERFSREAQAIAQLEHPHILPVYDFGKQADISYIVMKYVPAGTLRNKLGAPMSPAEAVEIIDQIASALDAAHSRGILHRDVKPGNMLLDEHSWLYLSDFGLAKMVEGSVHLTGTGVGVGTPAYMSPEQAKGMPVDARTDVYSVGVILFEMLTGRVPYEADTPMAVVIKHVTDPIPLPRQMNPNIPETVERVLLKALAKNRDHRFATVGALATALRRAVEGLDPGIAAAPIAPDPDATVPRMAAPVLAEVDPPAIDESEASTDPQPGLPAPTVRSTAQPGGSRLPIIIVGFAVLAIVGGLSFVAGWLYFRNGEDDPPPTAVSSQSLEARATTLIVVVSSTPTPTNIPLPDSTPTATPTPEPNITPTSTSTLTPSPTTTATLAPTLTSTLTPSPTTTSTPTWTPSPTLTPTPSTPNWPDTGLRPNGRVADIWTTLGAADSELGYPLANLETDSLCARENFERGYMVWFDRPGNTDLVWAAVRPNSTANSGSRSYKFTDTWPGSPEYWCEEAAARAPLGPKRGFGMLWCIYPNLQADIGYAIDEEIGGPEYPRCEGQLFQGGAILHNPLDSSYWVFIENGGWYRFDQ
jgi:serine/threonine protein kinase